MRRPRAKERKPRRFTQRPYWPQPEDFYGLAKLYEFKAQQAENVTMWDDLISHHLECGDVATDSFGLDKNDAGKVTRAYRDKSTTVTAVLALYTSSQTRKGKSADEIAKELQLKPSYVETIVATYKPLPEDPFEVVQDFPIEFVMWAPSGEAVEIFWKHNPATTLSAKKRQERYIKRLKEENIPSDDIMYLYKLGFRINDERLPKVFEIAAAKGLLSEMRDRHPKIWADVIELNLGNLEIVLLTDKITKDEFGEEDRTRFAEVQGLIRNSKKKVFTDEFLAQSDAPAGDVEPTDDETAVEENFDTEQLLLQLMSAARTQRICHLVQIEMKYLKVPKSLAAAVL